MSLRFCLGFLPLVIFLLLSCSVADCTSVPNGFRATLVDKEGNTFDVFDLTYVYIDYQGMVNHKNYYIPINYKDAEIAIPFENISVLSLNTSQINLTNGISLNAVIPWLGSSASECGFKGKTKFADYFLDLGNTQKVIFHHELDNNTRTSLDRPGGIKDSNYIANIETWSGNKFTFSNANKIGLYSSNDNWLDAGPILNFKQGAIDGEIDFKDVKMVKFFKENESSALITTTSGETMDVSLPFAYGVPMQGLTYCIGGKLESLGYARIPLSRIKELEIKS
jgi:hypothetical protein